ncbi:MAG: CpaF family protein, partial [Gemmatimonadetes bacterium]|nr:CpaF family protein [Gemmatimonadota bacterium]
MERLNLSNIDALDRAQVVEEIRKVVHELLAREAAPLNLDEREDLVEQILDEIFGLGPIEPLLQDPTISDILVNTSQQVYIEKQGRLEKSDVRF